MSSFSASNPSTDFATFVAKELNPQQQQAVAHTSGSLLVVAGAGSGKTRVITARIAHLILNEQIDPATIVALTFTNKAAKQMQERIGSFIGSDMRRPFIGTFHSYCLRVLKTNVALLPFPTFSILDEDDQLAIVRKIIDKNSLNKKASAQQLLHYISNIKNQMLNPDSGADFGPHSMLWVKQVYTAYEAEKKASNCFDFDDLLIETLNLFKKNATFKKDFQQAVRHILVDEYQDTNVVQHELLKQMAKQDKKMAIDSICAVGDEDQSIYSWRGATVANIMHFTDDFAPTTIIKLEQNYRSVQPILDVANKVIAHNKFRNPKQLWSQRPATDRIRSVICLSDYQEADVVATYIAAARKEKIDSIAILYRAHYQSRTLEEALLRHSIPYTIVGGIQFYERKEIKDMLAYLRLVMNPFDRPAFMRVVNTPKRSLGDKFEELIFERWNSEPFTTFIELGDKLIQDGSITGTKKTAFKDFLNVFTGLTFKTSPTKALEQIIAKTEYLSYIKRGYETEEALERIDIVKELLNATQYLETTNNITSIELFLHEVALMQEKRSKDQEQGNPVLLMTLHAAKGLEFETVILTGLEDGLLPSSRSLNELNKLEEERRLFYVGITRAEERLLLTRCRFRYTYGQMNDQLISRFMKEIPQELVPTHDLAHAQQGQIQTFMSQWLKGINLDVWTPPSSGQKQTSSQEQRPVRAKPAPVAIKPVYKPTPAKKATIEYIEKTVVPDSPFKKNQPVNHVKYGVGIVVGSEARSQDTVFVEVKFKSGTKKIAASFLRAV